MARRDKKRKLKINETPLKYNIGYSTLEPDLEKITGKPMLVKTINAKWRVWLYLIILFLVFVAGILAVIFLGNN